MVGTIFDVMNMFLGAVGIVTLALGAIGVINIMLVAVTERTHEIGLRKALGATNRSILFQFFLEGLLLTLGSGLIGMFLAGGLMAMMGTVRGPGGFDPPKLVPMSAFLAIGSLTLRTSWGVPTLWVRTPQFPSSEQTNPCRSSPAPADH